MFFLPHQPAVQTASSGLSPPLTPPPARWVEAAGGNRTASHQSEQKGQTGSLTDTQILSDLLTSGRSASIVVPISLWRRDTV